MSRMLEAITSWRTIVRPKDACWRVDWSDDYLLPGGKSRPRCQYMPCALLTPTKRRNATSPMEYLTGLSVEVCGFRHLDL